MALGRAKPGGLRDLFNVLIDIAIQYRHQRLDVEHIPAYCQIALCQLRRQRGKLTQLGVKVGQHNVDHRLRRALGQHRRHRIQLLYRGAW